MPFEDIEKISVSGYEKPVKTGWPEEIAEAGKEKAGFSAKFGKMSRWLFWILIAGISILMAVGGYYIYQYFAGRDIVFSLNAPPSAMAGVPFSIKADIQNNYSDPIQDVRISMILPDGAVFKGENPEKRSLDESYNCGDLEKDSSCRKEIQVIFLGNGDSLEKFEMTVSYASLGLGSGSRFEQTKSVEVSVGEPGIKTDITVPQKVLNGQDFEAKIHYQNVSDFDFSGVELKLDYPDFFKIKNSSSSAAFKNKILQIGDLKKGEDGNLDITGNALVSNKSFFEIKSLASAEISGQKYGIGEKTASLGISSSLLNLNVSVNDKTDYIANAGDYLKYRIAYRNDSNVGMSDAVITAKLSGEMFDFNAYQGKGSFNSNTNTIVWNAGNTPNLRSLASGVQGYVEFEIKAKTIYPIKRVSDKDFILKVSAEISSPTIPEGVASDKTVGLADLSSKVAGKLIVTPKIFFREPDASFANKGNFPLQTNQPTELTVHWLIVNYSTDVQNAKISAYLQSGVRWTGQVKSNTANATTTYNERTQEVSTVISKIPATKGVVGSPIEIIFQIEATPNVTQANQQMPLLSETSIGAFDAFISSDFKNSSQALTSQSISF